MAETLLAGQFMFLKNNKNLFSLAGPASEISNQFFREIISLKVKLNNS